MIGLVLYRNSLTYKSYIVVMLFDNGFIKPCCFFKLVILHEENMSHMQTPCFILITELHRLVKYIFHLRILLEVPVDFGLRHQYWYIPNKKSKLHLETYKIRIISSIFIMWSVVQSNLGSSNFQKQSKLFKFSLLYCVNIFSYFPRLSRLMVKFSHYKNISTTIFRKTFRTVWVPSHNAALWTKHIIIPITRFSWVFL